MHIGNFQHWTFVKKASLVSMETIKWNGAWEKLNGNERWCTEKILNNRKSTV